MMSGLLRGVALSVLSIGAVAACGEKETAKAPAASPTAPAVASPTPVAPVLQARSETRRFKDWSVTCGNDGTCWAFGFAPEFAAGWVRIVLKPGPDARPQIDFGAWPDEDARPSGPIGLMIDGRTFAASLSDASQDEAPIGVITADTGAVIDAIAKGRSIVIRGFSNQVLSPSGAAAALLWIDEKQGRLETPTALIRRGDRPASAVPVAPALPVVTAAPAVDQTGFGTEGSAIPAALRARSEVRACLADSSTPAVSNMVMSARLDARTELWAVPCGSGAYNVSHNWYLTGPGGRDPRPAALVGTGGPGADPVRADNITVNGEYDPRSRTLSAFAKARGIGDCGTHQTWAWTGDRFALTEESSMGDCAGVPSDFWPVAWRTR
jgi:hypothetical protein